jgi:hypothetical protein
MGRWPRLVWSSLAWYRVVTVALVLLMFGGAAVVSRPARATTTGSRPARATTSEARATTGEPLPVCSTSAVALEATTGSTYAPGQPVVLRSTITNISDQPCVVLVGANPGFSPSFMVTDDRGQNVWDGCRYNDEPGACFHILNAHRLAPGDQFSQSVVWDQGTSNGRHEGRHLVPPGTYSLATHYQYIPAQATTTFTVCASILQLCGLFG